MHAHTQSARAGEGRPETRHPQTLAGCLASLKDRTWTRASPAPPAPPVPHKQTFSGQDVEHRKASASGTAETMIIVQKKKKEKNHRGGGGSENITLMAKKESLVGGSRKPPLLASQHANPSLFKLAKY